MAEWWSIEVLHGEVSAFRWQEQHDSALIEAGKDAASRLGHGNGDARTVLLMGQGGVVE